MHAGGYSRIGRDRAPPFRDVDDSSAMLFASLARHIVEFIPTTEEGSTLRVNVDLQDNFSMDQTFDAVADRQPSLSSTSGRRAAGQKPLCVLGHRRRPSGGTVPPGRSASSLPS